MITNEDKVKEEEIRVGEEVLVEEMEIEATIDSNSIVGIDMSKTRKVLRIVKGKKIIVFLDSEATHNFIYEQLVKKLSIST